MPLEWWTTTDFGKMPPELVLAKSSAYLQLLAYQLEGGISVGPQIATSPSGIALAVEACRTIESLVKRGAAWSKRLPASDLSERILADLECIESHFSGIATFVVAAATNEREEVETERREGLPRHCRLAQGLQGCGQGNRLQSRSRDVARVGRGCARDEQSPLLAGLL
jgi:hypothetical protein